MDPREKIRSSISKSGRGIEICPVHKPVAPKKEGFRCLSLDSRSEEEIRTHLQSVPSNPPEWLERVEKIDLKGSPSDILGLVRRGGYPEASFDYIISPHNLEHLPDPVNFLLQCQKILKPGGNLFVTMPDRRACFDYFRPFSTLADLLSAHFEKRTRPTQVQIFEHRSLNARFIRKGREFTSFPLATPPQAVTPMTFLKEAFLDWSTFEASPDDRYRDAHCWTFTPASFELILRDLQFLDIISFDISTISQAGDDNNEIYAHLTLPLEGTRPPMEPGLFYKNRAILLRKMRMEDFEQR